MKPYVLSFAGFDPSAGAGILSDIKTFEAHNVYGFGINTATTFQNDAEFEGVQWVPFKDIERQARVLFRRFQVDIIKIGLVESFTVLEQIISLVKKLNLKVKIIWDPILKASAGFEFHKCIDREKLHRILNSIYLITPNLMEAEQLTLEPGHLYSASILFKGGHSKGDPMDLLYSGGTSVNIGGTRIKGAEKHGTGCVLSSAIVANLANGLDLEPSCRNAKMYIESFIQSNDLKLGYHAY